MRSPLCAALLGLVLAVGAPLPAATQQHWPLEPGQRVRISSADEQGVFVVQTVGTGELMLVEVASDRMLSVTTGSTPGST
jgi:hypothetical protein